MNQQIAEKDWKHLHRLQDALIDRYCEQTLSHILYVLSSNRPDSGLVTYQKVVQYLKKREETLVSELNDFRRSNAIDKIVGIYRLGFFLDEEYDKFSDEVKLTVKRWIGLNES